MSAGHTPGPWYVTNSGVRDRGGLICLGIRAIRYENQEERYEAEVLERAANACLIASAPDLLAERDRLKALNAELVEALESYMVALRTKEGKAELVSAISQCDKTAIAALEKHKKETP